MKCDSLRLCCFHAPVFIRIGIAVCALLLLSGSVPAMPYAQEVSFYPLHKHDPFIHTAAGSGAGDADKPRHYYGGGDAPIYALKNGSSPNKCIDSVESDKQSSLRRNLLSVGIRARFSSTDALGDVAPEEFREYDAAVTFRLPWAWYAKSGWGGGIRLMASAGVLYGAGETALVVSLIPLVAFGTQDGRFTLDMGAGGALLSRHRFGTQDYGGYFQFALTAGVGVPIYKRLGVGYRFLHYSDAAIYGPHNTGADFHMLELTWRF